jgi:tetratricopeptide (TPR) repeat protein
MIFKIIRRDVMLLVLLALVSTLLFLLTRKAAAVEHQWNDRMAAEDYRRGTDHLQAKNINAAIASFQAATARNHDDSRYLLALANALTLANRNSEAQRVLLALHAASPENGEVNFELAKLTAARADVAGAVKHYQNAIYGIWPPNGGVNHRVLVRLDLIHFLIDHSQRDLALSELLALVANLPSADPLHLDAGRLFLTLNNPERALAEFSGILRHHPDDIAALAGAGTAEFQLGNYERARTILGRVVRRNPQQSDIAQLLATTDAVLTNDPLAPNISAQERELRLSHGLDHTISELDRCVATNTMPVGAITSFDQEGKNLTAEFGSRMKQNELETLRYGTDFISRAEQGMKANNCKGLDDFDQAWLLIGNRHSKAER